MSLNRRDSSWSTRVFDVGSVAFRYYSSVLLNAIEPIGTDDRLQTSLLTAAVLVLSVKPYTPISRLWRRLRCVTLVAARSPRPQWFSGGRGFRRGNLDTFHLPPAPRRPLFSPPPPITPIPAVIVCLCMRHLPVRPSTLLPRPRTRWGTGEINSSSLPRPCETNSVEIYTCV